MYYEINVAKREAHGRFSHYFATSKRSIDSMAKCEQVFTHFKELFPQPEYEINVAYYPEVGQTISIRDGKIVWR